MITGLPGTAASRVYLPKTEDTSIWRHALASPEIYLNDVLQPLGRWYVPCMAKPAITNLAVTSAATVPPSVRS